MVSQEKIFIIAPDKPAGDDFEHEFKRYGIPTNTYYATIAPRIVNNELSDDPQVQEDLKKAIIFGYQNGYKTMVIACNTLQFWIDKALKLLPSETKNKIRIITTFEVMTENYQHLPKKPVVLGTTATIKKIDGFPTLLTIGQGETQDLVQEIIWRVKAVTNCNFSSAPRIIEADNPKLLRFKTDQVVNKLKELGIFEVILACTELPIAFKHYPGMLFINPATLVAKRLQASL